MKQLMAIGVAAAVSAGASAQNAVQWRVEDGGNGHWYARVLINTQMSRKAFVAAANAVGAQPVALSSNAEELFVFSQLGDGFLGLSAAAGSSVFTWMTDPSNGYSNWGGSGCPSGPYPNNPLASERFAWLQTANCSGTQGTQIQWDDFQPSELPPTVPIIIEWSADCNADGLVDYGQIRAGQLPDANHNNIPDCCENGGSCCPGDTNNDQTVDGIDLATVLTRWGMPGAKFPQADCNDDGVIDGTDLAIVLAGWGGCA
ncbi:MAG: Dockerin type domain [Planctomycetota bacterium]